MVPGWSRDWSSCGLHRPKRYQENTHTQTHTHTPWTWTWISGCNEGNVPPLGSKEDTGRHNPSQQVMCLDKSCERLKYLLQRTHRGGGGGEHRTITDGISSKSFAAIAVMATISSTRSGTPVTQTQNNVLGNNDDLKMIHYARIETKQRLTVPLNTGELSGHPHYRTKASMSPIVWTLSASALVNNDQECARASQKKTRTHFANDRVYYW